MADLFTVSLPFHATDICNLPKMTFHSLTIQHMLDNLNVLEILASWKRGLHANNKFRQIGRKIVHEVGMMILLQEQSTYIIHL